MLNESQPADTDELSEELVAALKAVINQLEMEDRSAREERIPDWKRNVLFFHGLQRAYWDGGVRDWRFPENDSTAEDNFSSGSKIINEFRATLESIIAALSAQVPTPVFFPEDAENHSDITTAQAFQKIDKLLDRLNHADLLFVKCLYTYLTQGLVAGYNYHHFDKEYGVDQIPKLDVVEKPMSASVCSDCGAQVEGPQCQACGSMLPPQQKNWTEPELVVVGMEESVRGRERMEIWGPLNIKIPHYVTDIRCTPYLTLEREENYAYIRNLYPQAFEKIVPGRNRDSGIRNFGTTENRGLAALAMTWLRPWAFNLLDKERADQLQEQYPNGLCVVQVNDRIIHVFEESIETCWTVSIDPMSTGLHATPLGNAVAPIQEISTELTDLTIETIRHSIPDKFVDPAVVNIQALNETQNRPGMVYPAKARGQSGLDRFFYESRGATLSKDVMYLKQQMTESAQFVSGAYPSVYGGSMDGGSGTFREYNMSKNQSLQRLSLPWKILARFWVEFKERACRNFANQMENDEKFVEKVGNSFLTTWILKSQMEGKIGLVSCESAERLPVSWQQKQELLFQLITMNNPAINTAIFDPANVSEVARTLGWGDLHIPGDADRDKQLYEIMDMLQGKPATVEPEVDNGPVHIETCKAWLVSFVGLGVRETNPQAYMAVVQHMLEHQASSMPQPMPSGGEPPQGGEPGMMKEMPQSAGITEG